MSKQNSTVWHTELNSGARPACEYVAKGTNICMADAEDGMSEVEIEFSVEGEENGIQDEGAGNETETGETQAQSTASTGRRVQGE